MPILADALQEAGCEQEGNLNHCRSGGVHVRGCWLVDLVLGRQERRRGRWNGRGAPLGLRPQDCDMENPDRPGEPRGTTPAGGTWASHVAGFAGFFAGGGLCLAACYGLLCWYASARPSHSEANEEFGDVFVMLGGSALALVLSVCAALSAGIWASGWASRFRDRRAAGLTGCERRGVAG
jgi:hypothetical protein